VRRIILVIRIFLIGILLAAGIVSSTPAVASDSDNSPLAVDIFPPLQYPSMGFGVEGLRLSLVGVHREMRGLDLALLGNATKQMFKGLALAGLFNYNHGDSYIYGLQVAAIANINSGSNEIYGIQLALVNTAGNIHGLQIGLINITNALHGLQIGLLNISRTGLFHASPIINFGF
jgi:hypothetical protein